MFERYTEKARRAIFFARYEASQFGSPYIESEHLLLGLLRESKDFCRRLCESSPAAVDKIREQIEGHTPLRQKTSTSIDLPIGEECKRILLLYALEEADHLEHKHIGTEHLILGLLRAQDCYAAQLLRERGFDFIRVRTLMVSGMWREAVASALKSPGIPVGYSCQRLLYNSASQTIVVEMNVGVGGWPERLQMIGCSGTLFSSARLFVRRQDAVAYELIGDPAADVSHCTPVTCEKHPIVVFNSMKRNMVGTANWEGVYVFNLRTKELTLRVAKDALTVPGSLRSWIQALISLSDDGQRLYVNVGVEKMLPDGCVVDYYLASFDLAGNNLKLLCQLQDIRF
jgi:hypothetical protein